MKWYAAHIVMYVEFQEGEQQDKVPIWENIILIKAETPDEAYTKAEQKGKDAEQDDGDDFRWAGRPAKWIYAGIRKMVLCEDADEQPTDGTELTYTEMEVSKRNLKRFMKNKPVDVALI